MQAHERIYVAVDTTDVSKARALVEPLQGKVGGFKIGLELIMAIFAQLGSLPLDAALGLLNDYRGLLKALGENLFFDGKFDDIPNTIKGASLAIAPLRPKFFNVHASCGVDGMKAAVANRGNSKALAVTLLTSIDEEACRNFFGDDPAGIVPAWAKYAVEAGVDGLICSPEDLRWINRDEKLAAVPKMTPGVRPGWSQKGDQARVMTPKDALAAGVTWMVIGRPITECPDGPLAAVERIVEEIAT